MLTIVAVIVAGTSLIIMIVIAARHIAELRILNVETVLGKEERTKARLVAKRLERIGEERLADLRKIATPLRTVFRKARERFHARLGALEQSYEHAKQLTLGSRGKRTAHLLGLIREAEDFMRQERYEDAEQKYIAAIRLDKKNVDAYEGLGNLYRKTQKYPEAREALRFILKFRPNDASVHVSIGEVALAEGNPALALSEFRTAVRIRPGNPKYLDFLIETAILVDDRLVAASGLDLMRETNPENQKIVTWEERIAALPVEVNDEVVIKE